MNHDGVYIQYRARNDFERGLEAVTKQCLEAFPWMWVSCYKTYRIVPY